MKDLTIVATTVVAANDVQGIEMGVLSDGTTYLTGRALAKLCGTAVSTIINQKDEWAAGKRENKLARKLLSEGFNAPELCFPVKHKSVDALGYPEAVVMSFLDYYAHDSPSPSEIARQNFRVFGRAGLRIFVYTQLGYDPSRAVPAQWREFHDRLLLASCPAGYFMIFQETSAFVLNAIRNGLRVDEHTIPDISMGKAWSEFWKEKGFEALHGERIKHEHNYPDYFPQARSNPQHPWVYPNKALGDFRDWMQREYIAKKFPKYIDTKVQKGMLPQTVADLLLAANEVVDALPPKRED